MGGQRDPVRENGQPAAGPAADLHSLTEPAAACAADGPPQVGLREQIFGVR